MFKSIFSRLFKMYVINLLMFFTILLIAGSLFVDRYAVSTQTEAIMSASDTLEYWTGTLQIEHNDIRAQLAYKNTLRSWAEFINSDIIVVNLNGELSGTTSGVDSVPKEYLDKVRQGENLIKKGTFGNRYEDRQLTVGVPVKYNGTIVAAMFFNTPLRSITRTTSEIVMTFIMCALLSLAVAFVVIYFQSKRISKPIGEINNAARNIASGNFSDRVRVTSNDEIGQLASSFNFMADSIEKLDDMRSGFISDVSHELRTPMTSISGFAQSILDGTIPKEKQNDYLEIIVDESKRLSKLVNDMLDMSKMSSKDYQLTIEKFDLNELMRVCIISLENRITEKGLDLNVDFDREALEVLGDKDSIQRVILNLMDNAVKFSFENTTIGISTTVKDKKAYVSVGNFGTGIDREDLGSIFDRFYKTDKSRKRERTGAGLGLSLCKNILSLHKQSIWVTSEKAKEGTDAKYTNFTFTLETA